VRAGKASPWARIRLEIVTFQRNIYNRYVLRLRPVSLAAFSLRFQTKQRQAVAPCGQQNLKETTDMANGTVKWFNTTKGYGFIAPEEGGKDVFVHISAVERSGLTGLADDQKVTYELQEGRDGRQSAVNIELA
jgi:CspA family cold shock protein